MYRFSFHRPLIAISLGLVAPGVFAALQPLAEAPLASDTELHCHFNRDASTDCTTTYRYTILKPSGREMLSRIDFDYSEGDTFEVISAQSTQPGAKPVALDATQIDTRTAPNPDQGFSRNKQTSLAFPNLRVGTQIRYTVREHHAAKPLMTQFHYVLKFGASPARRDRFKARFTAERPIQWRSELFEGFSVTPSQNGKTLDVVQKAPTYLNYINEASNAALLRIPRIEIGSALERQAYFGAFAQRYNQILGANLPPQGAAAVVAVRGLAPAEQVAALMQHINDHYRYLGDWRATERGYVPFNLAEIEQHGYGDCKDLAILLTALLKASGIKAETAWVSRGDVVESLLIPGTQAPNHAIVRAEVDGQVWWLDPTNPVFAPGQVMPDIQDRWVLVNDAQGQVREEHIPLERPETTLRLDKQVHYDKQGDGATQATITFSRLPLMQLSVADRQQGSTATDQDICANFGNEISDCQITRPATGFVVHDGYTVTAKMNDQHALEKLANDYVYSDESLKGRWDGFINYRRQGQQAELDLGNPQTHDYSITLSGGRMEKTIPGCQVRSPWYDLDLQGSQENGGLRYHYRLSQKVRWLSRDEIVSKAFGKMIEDARACAEQVHQVVKL
ncbi:Transglutaminase-like superfamily protein [Pseudomonas sp. 22 E 5]|nr:Transglutaminase-like superfamily protein [Pseudomonas sp. 22 E 5]